MTRPQVKEATATAAGALKGVFSAALTPLDADLDVDVGALVRHARWLLDHGCDGLAVLGTTGEANSLTVEERLAILDALGQSGIPGRALLPGTGCCAIPDTVRLTRRALAIGAAGVLALPPFYYKNVSDDGVYASFARVIEGVGDERLRLYLYHFPKMSMVPIGHGVIERLLKDFGPVVAGMKDSSGELDNMTSVARAFPGFAVFAGWDHLMLPLLKAGGAGCITAAANIAAPLSAQVYAGWRTGDVTAAQARLEAVRHAISAHQQTAALKAVLARATGDPAWANVRPPLVPLGAAERGALFAALDATGYSVPPVP